MNCSGSPFAGVGNKEFFVFFRGLGLALAVPSVDIHGSLTELTNDCFNYQAAIYDLRGWTSLSIPPPVNLSVSYKT